MTSPSKKKTSSDLDRVAKILGISPKDATIENMAKAIIARSHEAAGTVHSRQIAKKITHAPDNPADARWLVVQAIAYWRSGNPLPPPLAQYFADAFEAALKQESKSRGRILSQALHLSNPRKRPLKEESKPTGIWMSALVDALGVPKSVAKTDLAEHFDVSEDTVGRHYKVYCAEEPDVDKRRNLAKMRVTSQKNFKNHPLYRKYKDRWNLS